MKILIDGSSLFDHSSAQVEIGAIESRLQQQEIAGMAGSFAVNMGTGCRKIVQHGTLRAGSMAGLRKRIENIEAFVDGSEHVLRLDGVECLNTILQSVQIKKMYHSGSGVGCEYKIDYVQQAV